MKTLAQQLASRIQAYKNCVKAGNELYRDIHKNKIEELCQLLPNGSGIDSGVELIIRDCDSEKLVFSFGFHHMDEHGGYDGWTQHTLIVTPSFSGINLKITGKNRNGIKEYLHDLFYHVFTQKLTD